jgi:hypothetical protein
VTTSALLFWGTFDRCVLRYISTGTCPIIDEAIGNRPHTKARKLVEHCGKRIEYIDNPMRQRTSVWYDWRIAKRSHGMDDPTTFQTKSHQLAIYCRGCKDQTTIPLSQFLLFTKH